MAWPEMAPRRRVPNPACVHLTVAKNQCQKSMQQLANRECECHCTSGVLGRLPKQYEAGTELHNVVFAGKPTKATEASGWRQLDKSINYVRCLCLFEKAT